MGNAETALQKADQFGRLPASPLVSVIITSYNRARYIRKAVSSALSQDYKNVEVIISDNCSSDETLDVLSEILEDPRVKLHVNKSNIGPVANFQRSLYSLASGELVSFISSDDYLVDTTFISTAVNRFMQEPSLVIVKGRNFVLEEDSSSLRDDITYYHWKTRYYDKPSISGKRVFLEYPLCPSVGFGGSLYRRDVLCHVGFGQNGDVCMYSDAQSTLKMLAFGDVSFMSLPSYVNRHHDANATGSMKASDMISNEVYINSVYEFMAVQAFADPNSLRNWRQQLLSRYYSGMMKSVYVSSPASYDALKCYLSERHPTVLTTIDRSMNWRLFRLSVTLPLHSTVWPLLGRIRAWLKGF